MKLIVDSMLGKLARRLRLLGLDTCFDPSLEDRDLLRISKLEGRLIVTRDTGIAKVRGAKVLLINSTDLDKQLHEFSHLTGIRFDSRTSFSRCPECNTPVEETSKEKVKNIIPKFVYENMDKFSYCPKCKKAYWQGTHYDKLIKELKNI
jgi:hypothetical protein